MAMANSVELLASYYTLAGDVYPFAPGGTVSPFPFRDRVEAAAKAGWRGLGLLLPDAQATQSAIGTSEMTRILKANGITYVELELLIDWYLDGDRRVASDVRRREILALAEALGARAVKVAPGRGKDPTSPLPEELVPDVPRMIAGFVDLCRDAAAHGTAIVMEISPFSNISTIKLGRAIVEGADQPNGGLLLDIWHVARGGNAYGEIAAIPARFIGAVELDDADATRSECTAWEDTIFHRKLPGEGQLNVPDFIRAVQAAGYTGPWGVEILSDTFRKLPLEEMARRAFDATMAQFAAHNPARGATE
jgi:sugar phosphate isomerase/epimerase